jgi:hypothetical protein
MEMQDKEFDKMFSAKLDDFEVEPSKAVWQGINDGLGNSNRKKILPFLGIAASIIVLLAAGIVFFTQKVTVVKPRVKNRVAVNHPTKVTPTTTAIKPQPAIIQQTAVATVAVVTKPKHIAKDIISKAPLKQEVSAQQQGPVQSQAQQVLASAISPKNDVVKPVATDSAKLIADVPVLKTDKPVAAVAVVPDKEKPTDTPPVKKHRIHTFGDMLNVVIAAVDKRKDKVIEFSNTDGDESTITGVNLGIIKIKKEN